MKKKLEKITQVEGNKWTEMELEGFVHVCCDCDSAHSVELKIVKGKFYTKWVKLHNYKYIK